MNSKWAIGFVSLICFSVQAESARSILAQNTYNGSKSTVEVKGLTKDFEIQTAILRPSWPGLYIFSRLGQVLVAKPIKHDGYGKRWQVKDQFHLDPRFTHNIEDVLMFGRVTYIAQAQDNISQYTGRDYLVYAIERNTGRLLGFHLFHRSVYFDGFGNVAWVILREGDSSTPQNFDPYGRRFVYELNWNADLEHPENGPLVDPLSLRPPYAAHSVLHTKSRISRAGVLCGRILGFFKLKTTSI